jgi:mannose/fructose/N-acetylgalactosamine-specific phosphotransferase system component IIC
MIAGVFLGVLAGSFLWMDRVYLFQTMVSRPIIIGSILGLVMNELRVGILIGASLELLWLNAPPVGSYLPHDESFCSAVAVPVAVLAGSSLDHYTAVGLSILLSLPTALVGRALDTHLRTVNGSLLSEKDTITDKDIKRAIAYSVTRGLLYVFLSLTGCIVLLGTLGYFISNSLSPTIISTLRYVPFICVIIGLAAVASRELFNKLHALLFIIGMVIVLLLSWIL